jgi:type IV pilus assembly protein PilB
MKKSPTVILREKARELGMRMMRDDGILKLFDGITTVEEVSRET